MKVTQNEIRGIRVILAIAVISLLTVSAYEVVNNGHEVKWTFTLGASGYSDDYYSAQAANGTIYVYHSLGTQNVYAISPDGKTKWSISVESSPVIARNGTLYVQKTLSSGQGPSLCAYTPGGSLAWSYEVENGSFEYTTIRPDGTVYTDRQLYAGGDVAYGYEFLALSPQGHLLWKQWTPYAAPFAVTGNGTILLERYDGNLTAYNPNGSIIWIKPLHQFFDSPLVSNGVIYFVNNLEDTDGLHMDLYAMDLNSSLLWRYPGTVQNISNSVTIFTTIPVVDGDGNIYFARYNGTGTNPHFSLFAINPNGTLRWEYRDSEIGAIAIHDSTLVFGSSSGLTALDLNGHVKWKLGGAFDVRYANPAIGSDGTVYAITTEGVDLVADSGVVAVGENPIVLEIGALISLPIIAICLAILWKTKKDRTLKP